MSGVDTAQTSRSPFSVSVVIPTYMRAQSVGRAIDSVLSQSRKPEQVIVVDDGSTDNTSQVLAAFGNAIEVVTQPVNQGVSKARNAGCALASNEWITFLDSDDVWEQDRLAILERDVISHKIAADADETILVHLADLVFTGPSYTRTLFDERGISFPKGQAAVVHDPLDITLPGCSLMSAAIQRSAFMEAGELDESLTMYEDLQLLSALAVRGGFLVTGDIVATCERLDDDAYSLTKLEKDRAELAQSDLALAYRSLLDLELSPSQRRRIEAALSGALHALARAQWATDRKKARATLFEAARHHPSPVKGLLKSLAPLVMGETGFRHTRRARQSLDRS